MEIVSISFMRGCAAFVPTIIGVAGCILAVIVASTSERWQGSVLALLIAVAAASLITLGRPWVDRNIDAPYNQAREKAAIEEIEPLRDRLAGTRFPLKELAQQETIGGEIQGTYVLVAGGVYGRVDEKRELIIVYFDCDVVIDEEVGVWRVMVLPLEEVKIITIPSRQLPYLRYDVEIRTDPGRVALVAAEAPTLYLPEGWQLIGASEQYR